jgi:hypothetical protein
MTSKTCNEIVLEVIKLSSVNKVGLVKVFFCSHNGSKRDDPYWASRYNSLESDRAIQYK